MSLHGQESKETPERSPGFQVPREGDLPGANELLNEVRARSEAESSASLQRSAGQASNCQSAKTV